MKSLTLRRKLVIAFLGVVLLCPALYYARYYSRPAVWATFWIRTEVSRIPGVTFQNVIDVSSISDQEVYTFLNVEGKGLLVLRNVTVDSFTTEVGPVILTQIGGCRVSPINLNQSQVAGDFPALYVTSIPRLVQRYDETYAELHLSDSNREPTTPHCLPGQNPY